MLNSKQKKCTELMAEGCYTQKKIAEMLDVSEATICNWKKDREFIDEYVCALKSSMRDIAAKAIKTEISLLKAKNEQVRLAAAKDILDRAGFKPDDNINLNGEAVVLVDDLKE